MCALNNPKRKIKSTLTNWHPNEYSQKFHCYPFTVKLDRCAGSCNTINELSNKVCIPNKTEDLNLSMFSMITWKNESKILTKTCHTNVNVNLMEENVIQSKNGITINFNASAKTMIYVKKIILVILLHVVKKMENILDSYENILVYDI